MDTIKQNRTKLAASFAKVDKLCSEMEDEDCHRVRDILEHLTNRWALWALSELGRANKPLRFSQLEKQMNGVTQKVLTQTLRMLENNGLLTRKVFPEVPPRVDYALTPIGGAMLAEMLSLWIWVAGRFPSFCKKDRPE